MNKKDHVLFCSGGNDSVALVRWAFEKGLKGVAVCYSNTGWAAAYWKLRIKKFKKLCEHYGFQFFEIQSEGMESLVLRKNAFPANRPKFCTGELKIIPAIKWLEEIDPRKESICYVGVRREESARRANWPEEIENSRAHGGRTLFSPLVRMTENDRDALVSKTEMEILPFRSKECSPCVNANRSDFLALSEADILKVEKLENKTGRTMFRPHRFMGAKGIREVMRWAKSGHGKYVPEKDCDSGMCGD